MAVDDGVAPHGRPCTAMQMALYGTALGSLTPDGRLCIMAAAPD
jgi:hypothetical protein